MSAEVAMGQGWLLARVERGQEVAGTGWKCVVSMSTHSDLHLEGLPILYSPDSTDLGHT